MTDPGSVLQLGSALTSLIQAVNSTVTYVKKLHVARDNAITLSDKVNHLSRVLKSMESALATLGTNHEYVQQQTTELYHCVEGCFRACNMSMRIINARLQGLVESRTVTLRARFGFVSGEREIRSHEATIEGYLQMLQLCLIGLNGVSNSVGHAKTHQILEQILRPCLTSILFQTQPTQVGMTTNDPKVGRANSLPNVTTALMLDGSEVQRVPFRLSGNQLSERELDTISARIAQSVDHVKIVDEGQVPAIGPVIDMPLAIAVKDNRDETVKALVEQGADLTGIVDAYGWTLLHHATFERSEASLRALLQISQVKDPSFLNKQNNKGHTALMVCAQQVHWQKSRELACLLINSNARVNVEDRSGRTALYFAVKDPWNERTEKFVRVLLEGGATFGENCTRVPHTAQDYDGVKELLPDLERVNTSASASQPPDGTSDSQRDSTSHRSWTSFPMLRRTFTQ